MVRRQVANPRREVVRATQRPDTVYRREDGEPAYRGVLVQVARTEDGVREQIQLRSVQRGWFPAAAGAAGRHRNLRTR